MDKLALMNSFVLQMLPSHLLERLVQDVYDEVERRDNDMAFLSETTPYDHNSERFIVPFLPVSRLQRSTLFKSQIIFKVNPMMSATRNQSRQKMAKFGAREFTTFIIDVLTEVKRRHDAAHGGSDVEVQRMNETQLNTPCLQSPTKSPAPPRLESVAIVRRHSHKTTQELSTGAT